MFGNLAEKSGFQTGRCRPPSSREPNRFEHAIKTLHEGSLFIILLVALLILAVAWAVYAWNSVDVAMSVHGYVAMFLGIFFSLLVGCGLMALVFYSSRRGYDEPPDIGR